MKTINLTRFNKLREIAINKIEVSDFSTYPPEIKEQIKNFEQEGIDVHIEDFFETNDKELFTILKDGSIRKAIIHIVDITNWRNDYALPKFHIYNCETIDKMKNNNRGYRYNATGRSDGSFRILKKDGETNEELNICSHCLKLFNDQFNEDKSKNHFNIKKYFQKGIECKEFMDTPLDLCAIPSAYSNNWSKISRKMKERNGYKCSKCESDYSLMKKCLHTHHKDSNRRNNVAGNLEVLCFECHSKEFNHGHLKQHPDFQKCVAKGKK